MCLEPGETFLSVVFTQDHCAETKSIRFQVCIEVWRSCILTKVTWNITKSYLQFKRGISQVATEFKFWIGAQKFAYRLILSAKKKSKNQHQKINIPSSSVLWFGDFKVLIQRKNNSGKPRIWIMSFALFLDTFSLPTYY